MRKDVMRGLSGPAEKPGAGKKAGAQPVLKPAPLPKRFYKNICIAEAEPQADKDGPMRAAAPSFAVLLDGRAVKTPSRRPLILPSRALAELIADEFRLQKEVINPAFMPVTRLANTVIDGIAADMQPVAEDMLRYIACDMVFYRADSPRELTERQNESWDKVLDWAWDKMGAEFLTGTGVMFIAQKPEALAAAGAYLRQWLTPATACTPFALAALHLMTGLTGSALLAFMVEAGALDLREAWDFAHIEEDWTNEQWGKDEEALLRRAARERDFYAAATVLSALKE